MIVAIITALGQLLAALPGPIAQAITGGQNVQDAIANAKKAAEALPEREAAAGDDTAGAWDRDLEERKARGEDPIAEVSIVVNGRTVEAPHVLTYERAVELARLSGTPTVTLRRGGKHIVELRPGDRRTVQPGIVVDVSHTSGA